MELVLNILIICLLFIILQVNVANSSDAQSIKFYIVPHIAWLLLHIKMIVLIYKVSTSNTQ